MIYGAAEEDINLVTRATDSYVKNHSISFYKCGHRSVKELGKAHASHVGCSSFCKPSFWRLKCG